MMVPNAAIPTISGPRLIESGTTQPPAGVWGLSCRIRLRSAGWRTNTICLMHHSDTIFRRVGANPWERGYSADVGIRAR